MTLQTSSGEVVKAEPNDKEINFRKQEQAMLQKLQAEQQARIAAEERANKLEQQHKSSASDDDDNDDEPYVDKRRLAKKFSQFEAKMEERIEQKAQQKAAEMIDLERRNGYIRDNGDFNAVMGSDVVQKFADKYPKLAENILRMPEGFERQKLVYETIKAMGVDKPAVKEQSVQEKIDANRRSPYYTPSGIGTAPYAAAGDYSPSGQQSAYAKMQELKSKLRL